MIYKNFQDIKLSALGLGAMRLPTIDGDNSRIDEEKVFEMVDRAFEGGINYFDTAWGYHGGMSEIVLGNALKRHSRDSFYLASKFPGYDLNNMSKIEEIFNKQLEKCGVDYFDFYLYHNLCEMNVDAYLDDEIGLHKFLMEEKAKGRIKHLGFSTHATLDTTKRFLEKYHDDIEFCQIQLNYIDYHFQDAKAKIALCNEYNIPVWVMEPVRGGRLARLSTFDVERLTKLRPNESVVGWAFRFLQSVPEVTMILSGMSNMEQLNDNIATFATNEPTSDEEREVLFDIAKKLTSPLTLACTACRYCIKYCPMAIDIPRIIELYNEDVFTGGGIRTTLAFKAIDEDKHPSACIGCKSCEGVCPQKLKIADMMSNFSERLATRK